VTFDRVNDWHSASSEGYTIARFVLLVGQAFVAYCRQLALHVAAFDPDDEAAIKAAFVECKRACEAHLERIRREG
jgi:hypothetical protein